MSRFLRIFAYFCLICFSSNAFAGAYSCPTYQKYTSCQSGYYMSKAATTTSTLWYSTFPYNGTPAAGNVCTQCPSQYSTFVSCPGGTKPPLYKISIQSNATPSPTKTDVIYLGLDGKVYSDANAENQITSWTPDNLLGNRTFAGVFASPDGAGTKYINADGTFTDNLLSFRPTSAKTLYANNTLNTYSCSAGQYLKCTSDLWCECNTCPAGKYCAGGTFSASLTMGPVNMGITGTLPAGYYSTGGAKSATPTSSGCTSGNTCGPVAAGYYSTGGATSSTGDGAVAAGYYSTGGGTSATPTSSDCTSGNTCGPVAAGYYSQGGAKVSNPSARADCTTSYCGTVNPGYYSSGGGTSATPTATGNGCLAGYECGIVAAGYYSTYGATSSSGNGTVAAGYYSSGGGTSATPTATRNGCLSGYSCGPVAAGYYSTGGGTSATGACISGQTCGVISGGYYSTGGGTSQTPTSSDCTSGNTCGTVSGGYYSQGGGTSPAPTATGNGCLSGYKCGKTAAGYYSTGGARTATTNCLSGFTCAACPTGWTSDAGASAIQHCYKTFILDKNGASFPVSAWADLGLDDFFHPAFVDVSNSSTTGTATAKVWYPPASGLPAQLFIPDNHTRPSTYVLTGGVGTASSCTTGPTSTLVESYDGARLGYDIRTIANNNASGTTLYLCRKPATFSVSYDADGGSGSAPTSPTKCNVDEPCLAPENNYTKTGMDFAGWVCTGGGDSCNGDTIQPGTDMSGFADIDGSITLTARWTLHYYTITITKAGGTGDLTIDGTTYLGTADVSKKFMCGHSQTFGAASILPAWGAANGNALTKDGQIFTGWSETANFTCTKDVVISAVWEPATCTARNPSVASISLARVSNNAPVCAISCVAGYYSPTEVTGIAGIPEYVPGCSSCQNGYWSADGATSCTACPIGTTSNYNGAATGCTPCSAGTTTSAAGARAGACNVTCPNASNVSDWETSTWDSSTNTATNVCAIKYCGPDFGLFDNACVECACSSGGTVESCSVGGSNGVYCNYNITCIPGYHLSDGSCNSSVSNIPSSLLPPVSFSSSCVANTYTVQYDANGGTGTTNSQNLTYGIRFSPNGSRFTYAGRKFLGWAMSPQATTPEYIPGQTYYDGLTTECSGTVTLYAVWEAMVVNGPQNNSKVYDGTPLICNGGLSVTSPSGAEIKYATSQNGEYDTDAPTITYVKDSKTIYYQISATDYTPLSGSFECTIEKAPNPITLSADSGHVPYGGTTTVSVSNAQGSLSVSSNNASIATATLSGTQVVMTAAASSVTKVGITVTAAGNDNYLAGRKYYTLYVDQGIITLDPGAGTGGTSAIYQQSSTNVWLDTWNGTTMTPTTNPIRIPSRRGYAFAGYYAHENYTNLLIVPEGYITPNGIDAAKKAGSNITWVAKWTPNTITINYDSNGGTSVASTTCQYDSTFVLAAAPANSGKQFTYWSSVNGEQYNSGATIDCNYATLGVTGGAARIVANWRACPAGSYCPTDGAPQACPPNYPNSDVGATSSGNCYLITTAGNYVATKNAAEVTCKSGGYYCEGGWRIFYGLTGGFSECDDLPGIEVANGTYSTSPSTGASASSACRYVAPSTTVTGCSTVTANTISYTGSKWNSNYYTVTAAKGNHVGDNNVANPTCVVCGADKYQTSNNSTATSCTPCLANYHTYGNTAADHDAASDCQISCDGGSYLAKANDTTCTNVGAGYWARSSMVAQGSAGSRGQCKNGWTTIGYGFGANEEDDCGRIFNYGNQKIYLRSAKRGDASQPALHVKIGDVIFYGTMKQVSGPQSGFNAEYGGKNYLITNDDQ